MLCSVPNPRSSPPLINKEFTTGFHLIRQHLGRRTRPWTYTIICHSRVRVGGSMWVSRNVKKTQIAFAEISRTCLMFEFYEAPAVVVSTCVNIADSSCNYRKVHRKDQLSHSCWLILTLRSEWMGPFAGYLRLAFHGNAT